MNIIKKIETLFGDGRDLAGENEFIEMMIQKYSAINKTVLKIENDFDLNWLNPESLQGIRI